VDRPKSRREFLQASTVAAVGTAAAGAETPPPSPKSAPTSFLPILRPPDRILALTEGDRLSLEKGAGGEWGQAGVRITTEATTDRLAVHVTSEGPLRRVQLRWNLPVVEGLRVLGDHWERGYGDLEWRGLVPERPMPWFFLTHDGRRTHGTACGRGRAPWRTGTSTPTA
jgi:alpha-galactosidase